MNFIRVKCPYCSAILGLKNQVDIKRKSFKCPNCSEIVKFSQFKQLNKQIAVDDEKTSLEGEATELVPVQRKMTGELKLDDRYSYPLCKGINVIGRKAKSSTATIQIAVSDMRMSRSHGVIEVNDLSNGERIFRYSNAQNKNKTYINGVVVNEGDCIVLHDGDKILMADTLLYFTLCNDSDI